MRDVAQLKGFWDAMQALVAQRKLLAYHDRSDGGLLVTLAEMAFAGHCGVTADIAALGDDRLAALFNEELGAVIQGSRRGSRSGGSAAGDEWSGRLRALLRPGDGRRSFCYHRRRSAAVQRKPHHAAYVVGGDHRQMQRLRDNPECADQEHRAKSNDSDPGLNVKLSFDINEDVAAPYIATGARPKSGRAARAGG